MANIPVPAAAAAAAAAGAVSYSTHVATPVMKLTSGFSIAGGPSPKAGWYKCRLNPRGSKALVFERLKQKRDEPLGSNVTSNVNCCAPLHGGQGC